MASPTLLQQLEERADQQTQIYKNRELAIVDVASYIDTFYNATRRYSHLGGVSPEQFEVADKSRQRVSTKSWELHIDNLKAASAKGTIKQFEVSTQ